jgi:hypothetical protein
MRAILLIAALGLASGAMAATPSVPRASDGRPDLTGYWTNASVTRLTRSPNEKRLVVSPAEAKAMADVRNRIFDADNAPTDPGKGAPAPGDPGGYNTFWLDAGRSLGLVRGEYRTSWIVDPADGQLPLSDQGKALVKEAAAFSVRADTPDNPEGLEPWDRCIISSRGSGGPGMLNNIYNSNYQIVQTPGAVAIQIEMVHDVRTIPLFANKAEAQAGHRPAALQPWLGDSTGWWEGDVLVVETVNVNREQGRAGPLFLTPQGRVTERFERVSPGQIAYSFEVEDRAYYTRPWRAEMSLNARPDRLFEYTCHEGNYAMGNILRGVRVKERATASAP